MLNAKNGGPLDHGTTDRTTGWKPTLAVLCLSLLPLMVGAQFGLPQRMLQDEVPDLPNVLDFTLIEYEDLDGDGLKDILSVGYKGDLAAPVWFKNEGNGSYTPARPIGEGMPYHPQNVLAMDVNGDGLRDIVTIITGPNWMPGADPLPIIYYENLGGGVFADSAQFVDMSAIPAYYPAFKMMRADLDGDLVEDLVVSINSFSTGRRLWWYANTGNGFGPAQTLLGPSGPSGIVSMDVQDIDNDGDNDIAYCTLANTDQIGLLINNGSGGFSAPISLTVDVANCDPGLIRIVDMDQDGDMDLVCLRTSVAEVRVYENDGSGQFDTYVSFPSGVTGQLAMTVMDIDQNGYPDLVVSNWAQNTSYSLMNAGTGAINAILTDTLRAGATALIPFEDIGSVERGVYSFGPGGLVRHRFNDPGWAMIQESNIIPQTESFYADWDGDGYTDIIRGSDVGNVYWYRNVDGTAFDRSKLLATGMISGRSVEVHDFNGDGELDLMIRNSNQLRLLPNLGNGLWGAPSILIDEPVRDLRVADVDGDGDLDVVIGVNNRFRSFVNDGSGVFTSTSQNVNNLETIRLIDLNEDGRLDVLGTATSPARMFWFPHMGASGYVNSTVIPTTVPVSKFELSDLDADGKEDIVGTTPNAVGWLQNTGSATFAPWIQIYNGPSIWALHYYDLNTDGIDDLLLVDGSISIIPSLGPSTFATTSTPLAGAQELHSNLGGMTYGGWCADLDNDGDLELVFSGKVSYTGPKFLAVMQNFSSASQIKGTSFVDSNGDGVHNVGETGIPWLNLILDPLGSQPMTSSNGDFMLYAEPSSYDLQCPGPWDPALWSLTAGASGYQFVLDSNSVVDDLNFGLTALVDSSLIAPSITFGTGVCGAVSSLWIAYVNQGTRTEAGEVQLTLDPAYTFISSVPSPLSVQGNVITWAYDSLPPFQSQAITAEVLLPSVAFMGDTLTSTLQVSTVDNGTVNAVFETEQRIEHLCAYDPNDKLVAPAGYTDAGYVDIGTPYLDFTIRFQNTGSAAAVNVVLRDALSNSLNHSSLRLLGYSHTPSYVRVHDDGELEIRFMAIMLPDSGTSYVGSQGYIRFRLDLMEGLPELTEIHNQANIYFDLNDAVVTNTTHNTLVDCNAWMPEITFLTSDSLLVTAGHSYQWYFNGEPIQGSTGQVHHAQMLGSYSALVRNEFGCSSLTPTVEVIALGMSDRPAIGMLIYPNPVGDKLNISTSEGLTTQHRIEMIDALGRIVQASTGTGSTQLSMDCDQLESGPYVLRILHENRVLQNARIVVQH